MWWRIKNQLHLCKYKMIYLYDYIELINLLLVLRQIIMKNSNNDQNCDINDDDISLLSQKMESLAKIVVHSNCLTTLASASPNSSLQRCLKKSSSIFSIDTTQTLLKHSAFRNQSVSKKKLKKRDSKKQKSQISKELMRLFQVHSACGEGRTGLITQVKDTPISQFSGRGLLVLPSSKKYQGEWVDGNLMGVVKISYPNGNIYEGQVYNYKKHGKGTFSFSDGQKYVGEFSGGDFHGQGVMLGRKGQVIFDGLWRRGKPYDK